MLVVLLIFTTCFPLYEQHMHIRVNQHEHAIAGLVAERAIVGKTKSIQQLTINKKLLKQRLSQHNT